MAAFTNGSLVDVPLREIVRALRAGDSTKLAEYAALLPLSDLEGNYEGVIVEPSQYDPDEIGRDLAVEILENGDAEISEERAAELLDGGAFTTNELDHIKRSILDDRTENSDGAYATLWIADLTDETGFVSVVWHQFEDGSREFECFVEEGAIHLAELEARGIDLV